MFKYSHYRFFKNTNVAVLLGIQTDVIIVEVNKITAINVK